MLDGMACPPQGQSFAIVEASPDYIRAFNGAASDGAPIEAGATLRIECIDGEMRAIVQLDGESPAQDEAESVQETIVVKGTRTHRVDETAPDIEIGSVTFTRECETLDCSDRQWVVRGLGEGEATADVEEQDRGLAEEPEFRINIESDRLLSAPTPAMLSGLPGNRTYFGLDTDPDSLVDDGLIELSSSWANTDADGRGWHAKLFVTVDGEERYRPGVPLLRNPSAPLENVVGIELTRRF